jgi:predicted regulator of Ras-like GTPase activity (Roadblock/LC7/MglB family)
VANTTSPLPLSKGLSWLLEGLLGRVPHAHSAVLATADGFVRAAHGLEPEAAEHLASVASGQFSLAKGTAAHFGGGGVVQVMVEMDAGLLWVRAAGDGSLLAVLTGREVSAANLDYEMEMLITSVERHLGTPARQAEGAAT